MRFFSKKVTTDKITKALLGFFDADYISLTKGIRDLFGKKQGAVREEQNKELLVIPLLAIIRAVLASFGDTPKAKNIIGAFQHNIFNKYFEDEEKKNQFRELFWKRCDEYSRILNAENKDLCVQFGQIFCDHFFAGGENESRLAIMTFVGGAFLNLMVETKKFLDGVLSKFEVVR